MQKAWQRQMPRIWKDPRWHAVEGPEGAIAITIRTLKWKWPAWHTFITGSGLKIDIRETCPADVRAMARQDSEDAMWGRWTAEPGNEHLAPRPFIEPIQRWFAKKGWDRGTATAAHAVRTSSGRFVLCLSAFWKGIGFAVRTAVFIQTQVCAATHNCCFLFGLTEVDRRGG